MKKHNFSILVASLLSTIALVACNSGSSSSGSNPTPTVSPSTNPTVAPTTVPPIVAGESSIATLDNSSAYAISSLFSTAPSQGVWYQYYSSLNASSANPAPTAIKTMTQTSAGLVVTNLNTLGANVFYSANGSQFVPVKTAGGTPLIQSGIAGVVAGTTNSVIYGGGIRVLNSAGVASDLLTEANFTEANGSSNPSTVPAVNSIKFFGGKYYLFTGESTTATINTVYVSDDGSHWTGQAAADVESGITVANIAQVGTNYFTTTGTAGVLAKSTTSPITGYSAGTQIKEPDGTAYITESFNTLFSNGKVLYAGNKTSKNLYFLGGGNVASATAKGTEAESASAGQILIIDNAGTAYDTANSTYLTVSGKNVVSTAIDLTADNITALESTTVVNGIYNNQLITASNAGSTSYLRYVTSVAKTAAGKIDLALNATPAYTSIADFTAVGKEYIVMAKNGFTVMTSNNTFVPIASVPLVINSTYTGTEVTSSVSNGSSIVAIAQNVGATEHNMPYLYVSSGVGTNATWSVVATSSDTELVKNIEVGINNLYLITTTTKKFITATPGSLATWVQVADFSKYSAPSSTTAINGYNYVVTGTDVAAVATATSAVTNYVGVLPVAGNGNNVWLYNGTNFYISEYGTANLWMSASLTGGVEGWGTPTVAAFTNKGNAVASETFSKQFKWTGKTFVTTGKTSNQVYTSTTGATWPAQYTPAGVTVTGTELNQY